MLRITPQERPDGWRLKLEGRLVSPWTDLLRRTCFTHLRQRRSALELDLAGLEFAASDGLELLRVLQTRGARCVGWTPFLTEMSRPFHRRPTPCV